MGRLRVALWWLRKNWRTVLLGVLTLGIGLLIGKALKKAPVVVNPELVDAERVKREAQDVEDADKARAAKERDAQLSHVDKEHSEKVRALVSGQEKEAPDLTSDPGSLNSYLLRTGKDVRGG